MTTSLRINRQAIVTTIYLAAYRHDETNELHWLIFFGTNGSGYIKIDLSPFAPEHALGTVLVQHVISIPTAGLFSNIFQFNTINNPTVDTLFDLFIWTDIYGKCGSSYSGFFDTWHNCSQSISNLMKRLCFRSSPVSSGSDGYARLESEGEVEYFITYWAQTFARVKAREISLVEMS